MPNSLNMLKLRLFTGLLALSVLISCSDDDGGSGTPSPDPYMTTGAGATRDYSSTMNNPPSPPQSYRLTTTNRDTVVGTRTYRVFENNNGPNRYYNISGNDYYTFQNLGAVLGDVLIEDLYLKTNVNAGNSWVQTYSDITIPGAPGPASATFSNKIEEKGISKTVNGIAYSNVIHVSSTITSASVTVGGFPLPITGLYTNIHSYYAPRVGMIENSSIVSIDFMGVQDSSNVSTILTASNIP